MSEFEIQTVLSNSLIQQALYMFAFLFSTWFAGRCAVVTNEQGNSNLASKILISAFALSSIYYVNFQICWIDLHIKNYGHSLAALKASGTELSARAESAIELFGANASEVPTLGMIPDNPVAIIFVISITLIILTGIWTGGSNQDN